MLILYGYVEYCGVVLIALYVNKKVEIKANKML